MALVNPIKLVVFDWDGTLSNSGALVYEPKDGYEYPPLFQDVRYVLDQLTSADIELAIATSMSRRALELSLSHHKLESYFASTATASEHLSKPNPAMLEAILDDLCVEADHAVMVGDTPSDIEMAQSAGMMSIAVSSGQYDAEELKAYTSDHVFEHLLMILPALGVE